MMKTYNLHGGKFPRYVLSPPFLNVSCISGESTEMLVNRPGTGSLGPDCGTVKKHYCKDCEKWMYLPHSCMLKTCPVCYEKWAHKNAKVATINLLFNRHNREIVHAVISIPGVPEDIWRLLPYAYIFAYVHGLLGGAVVPHFERHGKIDGYLHYHVIGYYQDKYFPAKKGTTYKFKVIRWIHENWDLRGVLKYLFTHCATSPHKKCIYYFGQKFQKPIFESDIYSGPKCFFCGSRHTVCCDREDWTDPIRPDMCYRNPEPG